MQQKDRNVIFKKFIHNRNKKYGLPKNNFNKNFQGQLQSLLRVKQEDLNQESYCAY